MKELDDMFNRLDTIPECFRQTEGQSCYDDIVFCVASPTDGGKNQSANVDDNM